MLRSVLVVDDDPVVRRVLSLLLAGAGYRPREAAALADSRGPRPAMVITAEELRDGTGHELAERLRVELGVPSVLFGQGEEDGPYVGRIAKPCHAPELLRAVAANLGTP